MIYTMEVLLFIDKIYHLKIQPMNKMVTYTPYNASYNY